MMTAGPAPDAGTLPAFDSLSLLGNPWLDRDSEAADWRREYDGRPRPAKGGLDDARRTGTT